MTKPICFVIQEFDKGQFFDRLFGLVIDVAIEKSGFQTKRADKILGAKPPLTKIAESLNASSICLAEVTKDNPNVFLELGWAIGLGKPYFILWDEHQRPMLPFDISHGAGIPYDSSKGNWEIELKQRIIDNLSHEFTNIKSPDSKIQKIDDNYELDEIELSILGALLKAQSNNQEIGVVAANKLFISLGYESAKVTLIFNKLLRNKCIGRTYNSNGDEVCIYYLLNHGHQILENYYNKIQPILDRLPNDYLAFAPKSVYAF